MSVILALVCVIIGVVLTFLILNIKAELDSKRFVEQVEEHINNPEGFCYNHCKLYEECCQKYKDIDEVMDHMVNGYCISCPISIAQDIIDTTKRIEALSKEVE